MLVQDYIEAIERLSLSQTKIAKLFGVSPGTVRQWTTGEMRIPCQVEERLENACRVQDCIDAAERLSSGQVHAAKLFSFDARLVRRWTSLETPVPARVTEQLIITRLVQRYVDATKRHLLSQAYAAQLIGVSPRTLRRWAIGQAPAPPWVVARLENARDVQDYVEAARDLAMTPALAAKVFRVSTRTVRRWLSGETSIPYSVVRTTMEMVFWQIEPIEWRRAQDTGVRTSGGGQWLHPILPWQYAKQGLERDLVDRRWVIQPLGTRAARWDAPAARRKPGPPSYT